MARIEMWVIYENPTDYARDGEDVFVLRRWEVDSKGTYPDPLPAAVSRDLQGARHHMPEGRTLIPKFEEDDKTIVEVWV